ncbi:hypothetical protein BH10BDE1_BH10BDE1_25250 [soil metagenome]
MEKYILQLGDMTWSKVIIGGLIAAGAYWGLYYDDGSTLENSITALSSKYTESDRQLRETKEAMADAEKFEKAVRQNEIQFEKVLEYLPQEINANELTRLVNQQAQLSGPRVQSTKAIEVVEKKDFYEMTRLEFALQGSFSQVVLFLSSLSKIQRLLTFDKLQIKMQRSDDEVPSVELSGILVGYRYLKDADPAGQSATGGGTPNATGEPSGTKPK